MGLTMNIRPAPDDPTGPLAVLTVMAGTVQVIAFAHTDLAGALEPTVDHLADLEAQGEDRASLSAHQPF